MTISNPMGPERVSNQNEPEAPKKAKQAKPVSPFLECNVKVFKLFFPDKSGKTEMIEQMKEGKVDGVAVSFKSEENSKTKEKDIAKTYKAGCKAKLKTVEENIQKGIEKYRKMKNQHPDLNLVNKFLDGVKARNDAETFENLKDNVAWENVIKEAVKYPNDQTIQKMATQAQEIINLNKEWKILKNAIRHAPLSTNQKVIRGALWASSAPLAHLFATIASPLWGLLVGGARIHAENKSEAASQDLKERLEKKQGGEAKRTQSEGAGKAPVPAESNARSQSVGAVPSAKSNKTDKQMLEEVAFKSVDDAKEAVDGNDGKGVAIYKEGNVFKKFRYEKNIQGRTMEKMESIHENTNIEKLVENVIKPQKSPAPSEVNQAASAATSQTIKNSAGPVKNEDNTQMAQSATSSPEIQKSWAELDGLIKELNELVDKINKDVRMSNLLDELVESSRNRDPISLDQKNDASYTQGFTFDEADPKSIDKRKDENSTKGFYEPKKVEEQKGKILLRPNKPINHLGDSQSIQKSMINAHLQPPRF